MAQKTQKEDSECKIVPETITLCVNNCGVVGNPATNNMCQNCFKSTTSVAGSVMFGENSPRSRISPVRKAGLNVLAEPTTIRVENYAGTVHSASSAAGSIEFGEKSGGSTEKRRDLKISEFRSGGDEVVEREKMELPTVVRREVKRCSGCRRKVGLTGFRCRCGELFCSEHRYSDRHDCSYDYKAAGREAIARENPVVKAAKIVKF